MTTNANHTAAKALVPVCHITVNQDNGVAVELQPHTWQRLKCGNDSNGAHSGTKPGGKGHMRFGAAHTNGLLNAPQQLPYPHVRFENAPDGQSSPWHTATWAAMRNPSTIKNNTGER